MDEDEIRNMPMRLAAMNLNKHDRYVIRVLLMALSVEAKRDNRSAGSVLADVCEKAAKHFEEPEKSR